MKKRLHGNKAAPDRLKKGLRFATAMAMACFLAFAPAAPAFALAGADADGGKASFGSVTEGGSAASTLAADRTDSAHGKQGAVSDGGKAASATDGASSMEGGGVANSGAATPSSASTSSAVAEESAVSSGETTSGSSSASDSTRTEDATQSGEGAASKAAAPMAFSVQAASPTTSSAQSGEESADDGADGKASTDSADKDSNMPGTIKTVDTRPDNITINLFDYPDDPERQSVNAYGDFIFKFPIEDLQWMNGYVGGGAVQGIVQNRLGADGYPVLNLGLEPGKTNAKPRSLAYLFDPEFALEGKRSFTDVTHLFTRDSDGYYAYDSDTNYAYYNSDESGGDFVVYDDTYPGYRPSKNITLPAVGFFPFDEYNPAKTNIDPTGPYNHHLGLTMTSTFEMPENGKINGSDMQFEFAGDDDTWVFVDGVLVLDIGGIHGVRKGSINFATGDVNVDDVVPAPAWRPIIGPSSTLKDIFANQGLEWDGSAGKRHTVSFFYLERGNMQSNLKLKFNTVNIWNVAGHKTWVDDENARGTRPDSIGVHLLKDGTEVAHKTVTAQDGWAWSFDGLPKYENGKLVNYSVIEDPVQGYTSEVSGYDVVNTLIPSDPDNPPTPTDPEKPGTPTTPTDPEEPTSSKPTPVQGEAHGEKALPTTGDSVNAGAFAAIAVLSLAAIAGAVWSLRRLNR